MSEEGTTHVSAADMMKYTSNHLDSNQAFFNLSKVMLNLDLGSNQSQKYTSEAI